MWSWLALFGLLILSGFFSGMETALTSIPRYKVAHLVRTQRRGAKALASLKENMADTITTILIGNNVVNVGAAVLATVLFTELYGSYGAGIATGVITLLTLTFGEIVPKSYSLANAVKLSLRYGRIIFWLSRILFPFVRMFSLFTRAITRSGSRKSLPFTAEEFRTILEIGARNRIIDADERRIIQEVLDFDEVTAAETLIPANRVAMLSMRTKRAKALAFLGKARHTRIPIYERDPDEPIGYIRVKDLLSLGPHKTIRTIMIEPLRFRKKDPLDMIFSRMVAERLHLAFIYERKRFVGIITIEDALEEILGEIKDEKPANNKKR